VLKKIETKTKFISLEGLLDDTELSKSPE